jgi:hypothetical protein
VVKIRFVLVLVLVLVLDARAHANPIYIADEPREPADARNLFGFRFAFGLLPIDHLPTATYSVGLGVEHPVFGKWRVFGDYEWLWLERQHTDQMAGEHGDGQRVQVGVRRRLASKRAWDILRLYVDGELGGGFSLVNDNMTGMHALPDGLAGLRVGYDLAAHRTSDAKLLEFEVVVRAIAIPGGIGMMGGVGALWK